LPGATNEHEDVASASLLENGIDEAERRTWFLFEASRRGVSGGAIDRGATALARALVPVKSAGG
jgi:hypothetical protein